MVKTRSSVGKPVSSSSKSSAVFSSSSYPDRTVKKHGGKMEVRLQSSDGTTRSVQVQAMEPLLLSAAAAASSDDLRRYTPAAVAASLPPSQPGCYPPGGAGIIQREKRIGEPVTARDYLNPRKRARSTSPPPVPPAGRPISEQGAVGGGGEPADRMWVAAAAGGSRTQAASGSEKLPKGGAGGAGGPMEYLGGEESGDSEEEEEEEEEELPPGDRVAYIHVGEGGEADLEAQLKGEISNFMSLF
jgi:hypothetical protein